MYESRGVKERTLEYSTFNKPERMTEDGTAVTFTYGADRSRVHKTATAGGQTKSTWYVGQGGEGGPLFELNERRNADDELLSREHLHFIYAGGHHSGQPFAVHIQADSNGDGALDDPSTQYYHRDHLGSVIAVTDDDGAVNDDLGQPRAQLQSFDAFGKRRKADWSMPAEGEDGPDPYSEGSPGNLDYTGHEAVPGVGLIHMNGRVYDPELGRFLSADPHIQDPKGSQSYNRYSYVLNNPIRYNDPSGYFLDNVFRELGQFFQTDIGKATALILAAWGGYSAYSAAGTTAVSSTATVSYTAGGVAGTASATTTFTATTSVFAGTVAGGAAFGAINGAASGVAQTGTLGGFLRGAAKGGAIGAASGAMFGGIGAHYGNTWTWGRAGLNSLAGGLSSEMSGGEFEDGFRIALTVSVLTLGNYKMRQAAIKNSAQNPDNINGKSAGFFGDGKKVAGSRHVIDPQTGGYNQCVSLMGGCQGKPINPGDTRSSFFSFRYDPHSLPDYINEAYAGPHDWLRNATGSYAPLGNGYDFSGFRSAIDSLNNYTLIIPATPFAVAGMVGAQPYLYPGLVVDDDFYY